VKCHRVAGEGAGEAGPDLAGIGGRRGREYLLESIALPNRQIAVGYGNTIFVLKDSDIVDGRVIGETPTHWLVVTTDRGTVRVRKSAIASSRAGQSAMPSDLIQRLSKRDVRDLVAWLATLQDGQ
jgi:quinoprotein glucose dehydrogenase